MSKRVFTYLLIAVLLGVILTACEKPASTAPTTTPSIPFPVTVPTTSFNALATQTAIAKNPLPVPTKLPGTAGAATAVPLVTLVPVTQEPAQATAQPATATAQPEVVIPTATPGRPDSYTIQPGDHYICIARRYNVSLSDFFSLNGLSMSSQAMVGVTVKIPQSGSWNSANGSRTLKAHPDTFTVQSGDTLNKIACDYGDVDPNNIILANSLTAPYTLSAGQTLKIP